MTRESEQMSLIEKVEATRLLSPYLEGLNKCVLLACDDFWVRIPSDLVASFHPRTRANIIHCRMAFHVTDWAESYSRLRVVNQNQMFGLVVEDRLLLRLKKLGEDKISRNNLTQQVRDFKRQKQLDGLPPFSNLEVGYVLDSLEVAVKSVELVCPNGEFRNYWTCSISGEAEPNVIDMFQHQRKSPTETQKRFARKDDERERKKADQERDAGDES